MEITEREIEALELAWECRVNLDADNRPEWRGRLGGGESAFDSVDEAEQTFLHLWANSYLDLGDGPAKLLTPSPRGQAALVEYFEAREGTF